MRGAIKTPARALQKLVRVYDPLAPVLEPSRTLSAVNGGTRTLLPLTINLTISGSAPRRATLHLVPKMLDSRA